jgi:hypothetical protein
MGQQHRKIVKRRRRADYLKRKSDQAKLGGTVRSSAVKKADPAKKATAKKAAKKAPAKKTPKKVQEAEAEVAAAAPESTEPAAAEAVEHVAEKTIEASEATEEGAPQPE